MKNQFPYRIRTFIGMKEFCLCYCSMFSALFYSCARLIYHATSICASEHYLILSFNYDPQFLLFLINYLQIPQSNWILLTLFTLSLQSTGLTYCKNSLVTLLFIIVSLPAHALQDFQHFYNTVNTEAHCLAIIFC